MIELGCLFLFGMIVALALVFLGLTVGFGLGQANPKLPAVHLHRYEVTSNSIDLYNRPLTDEEIEMGAANMQKLAEAHVRQEMAKHQETMAKKQSRAEWEAINDSEDVDANQGMRDPCNGQLCDSHGK